MTEQERISVSRDALRAELAEMELRLRLFFDEQLRHKADREMVLGHSISLLKIEKGEFSPAMKASLEDTVEKMLSRRTGATWTSRERGVGIVMMLSAIVSVLIAFALAVHQWGG